MTVERIEEERNRTYVAMQRTNRNKTIIKGLHKMFRSPIPVTPEGDISLPSPLPFVTLVKQAIKVMKVKKIESAFSPETFIFYFTVNK